MSVDLRGLVEDAARRQGDAIERACEAMLTDPRGWGVLQHDSVDLEALAASWTVELSPLVPFGEIHTHRVHGDVCPTCGKAMD